VTSGDPVGVVGGGIMGLAVARQLARSGIDVVVFEKEQVIGRHQTGHNSGVVHAGIYYRPGSAKATMCRRGGTLLRAYCRDRGLPWDDRGKLVVARDATEVARLAELERRPPSPNWNPGSPAGPRCCHRPRPLPTSPPSPAASPQT